jgi:hypothetical protein
MYVEMIFAGAYVVGTVLAFTILFRALCLSIGLRSKGPSYQCMPTRSDVEQPSKIDQIFRAQERQV